MWAASQAPATILWGCEQTFLKFRWSRLPDGAPTGSRPASETPLWFVPAPLTGHRERGLRMQAAGTWKRSPKGFGPLDAQSKKCCFGGAGSSPWPCHRGRESDAPPSQTRKWGYLEFSQQGWRWCWPVHLCPQWGHPVGLLWLPRKVHEKKKSDWPKHSNLRRQWPLPG